MKVLITAPWVNQYADELRASFPSVEFIDGQKPEDALLYAADAEIIFGTVTSELLAASAKLRWIGFPAAGVEWMQHVPALIESDVAVTNARGAHATTIAEHTMGMLVFLARGFDVLFKAQQEKQWLWPPRPSTGLVGMTMGIIGLGQLGEGGQAVFVKQAGDLWPDTVDAGEIVGGRGRDHHFFLCLNFNGRDGLNQIHFMPFFQPRWPPFHNNRTFKS